MNSACAANPWVAQSLEHWRCEDLAMAESHGTHEFIGGGELGPHPETAAQTHGWRQPLGNYTENGPARRRVLPRAGGFKKSASFPRPTPGPWRRTRTVSSAQLRRAPCLVGYRERCLLSVFPLRKGETKGGRSTLNPVRLRDGWPGVGQPLNARRAPPATLCVEARAPPCKPQTLNPKP